MLTRLRIRNFKTLADVDIPLGQNVVLIGPNNSGKTSALQALSLWQAGLREWSSRRSETSQAKLRTGVTINRKALTHTPVADARRLWRDLKVKYSQKTNGSKDTKDIFLDVIVDRETGGKTWSCGFEFYYASTESIYCRPLRLTEDDHDRMDAPQSAVQTRVALLPTMSGLAAEEPELQPGRIAVLLGEGQTAQVLRNLCFQVHQADENAWREITSRMRHNFGRSHDSRDRTCRKRYPGTRSRPVVSR